MKETIAPRPTELTKAARDLVVRARAAATIVTRQDADAAGELIRLIRARRRAIQNHYKPLKAAVQRSLNEIRQYEREDLKPCEEADALLAGPLERWLDADKAAVEAENRRRLAEAEERAKADRERQAEALRAAAADALAVMDKRALERQARQVERSPLLPVVGASAEPAKIEGVSTPTRKVAEVVNLKALLRGIIADKVPEQAIKVDQGWLNEQATQRGKDLNFPGVIVVEKVTLSARGF